jgi:hypothetical protein
LEPPSLAEEMATEPPGTEMELEVAAESVMVDEPATDRPVEDDIEPDEVGPTDSEATAEAGGSA